MQMIYDAAQIALQSEMMKKLFEKEQQVTSIEDQANAEATKASQMSDACRNKAERLAEEMDRKAFACRKAATP